MYRKKRELRKVISIKLVLKTKKIKFEIVKRKER